MDSMTAIGPDGGLLRRRELRLRLRGVGFAGGEWRGGSFAYNTAVTQVNVNVIHVTYVNETIVHEGIVENPITFLTTEATEESSTRLLSRNR